MLNKAYIIFKKLVLFACILFLFTCCGQNNMYFITESFFWEVIDRNGELLKGLEKTAHLYNFVYNTVISDDDHLAVIDNILQGKQNSIVILSPFMNNLAIEISELYPENLFIIFGNIIKTDLPPNLLTVTFDRTEIYREAGKYTAEMILSADFSFINTKIGIIVSNISRQTEHEVTAFKEGILKLQMKILL